jgi:EAL domain-containing protein (putative c-di-GMP-specific phosphodiesterase class I)
MSKHLYSSPHLTSLLSRLGLVSPANATSDVLCIVASIANLTQIENAHGSEFAATMRLVIHERACQICEADPGIVTMSGPHILFIFDAPPPSEEKLYAPRATVLLERILSTLGDRPIEAVDSVVFPVISTTVAPWTDGPFDIAAVGASAATDGQGGREWRDRYLSDTKVAEMLFNAMDEDRLGFEWEPICDGYNPRSIQYYEALLCEIDAGVITRVGSMVPAIERLGLVRRLDQWVVKSVIDTLRLNRDICLGCNVSAQSASVDAWWAFVVATLSEEPDVASRLVIEITETVPLNDIDGARDFVETLQSLGCRIALDDVGGGYSSLKALVSLGVNIAKIDGAFVRHAREDAAGGERLRQLVGLAKTCAASVVVEGVESDDDAEISISCGATLMQGYLFSKRKATTYDMKPPSGQCLDG